MDYGGEMKLYNGVKWLDKSNNDYFVNGQAYIDIICNKHKIGIYKD